MPVLQDTLGKYPVATPNSSIPDSAYAWVCSYAQVYDLNSRTFWEDSYNGLYETDGIRVPALGATPSLNIEEIEIGYLYVRGTSVPDDIVDTLIVVIAAPATSFTYDPWYFAQSPIKRWQQPSLYYDPLTLNPLKRTSIFTTTNSKYVAIKRPLTKDNHGTSRQTATFNIADENGGVNPFENMTTKQFVIAVGYISAQDGRNLSSVLGRDVNYFAGIFDVDPRPEYGTNALYSSAGSDELRAETNVSLFGAYNIIYDTSAHFQERYLTVASVASATLRPDIAFYATCSECEWVSVKEMETKNITVSPNPATNVFKVTLGDDSAAQIELYNLIGQRIYNERTNSSTVNINVADLNQGVYMLKVSQNGKIYTSKVVVK
jgi:hypothetical protein